LVKIESEYRIQSMRYALLDPHCKARRPSLGALAAGDKTAYPRMRGATVVLSFRDAVTTFWT
jgi:hypothetical protein